MHICMMSTLCFRPDNTLTAGHYICHWFTGKSALLSGHYPTHNMKQQSILNKVTAAIFSRVTLIACSSQGSLSKCHQLWLPYCEVESKSQTARYSPIWNMHRAYIPYCSARTLNSMMPTQLLVVDLHPCRPPKVRWGQQCCYGHMSQGSA